MSGNSFNSNMNPAKHQTSPKYNIHEIQKKKKKRKKRKERKKKRKRKKRRSLKKSPSILKYAKKPL